MARKILSPLLALLTLVLICLGMFSLTAHAAGAVTPEDGSLLDLARPVFDAIIGGHYIAGAALALILIVAAIKRYAPGRAGTFVHSDVGGVLTTLVISFGGALATATAGDVVWRWSIAYSAGKVALVAAGGYTMIKKLLVVPLQNSAWYQNKAPTWFKACFGIVSWVFDKPDAVAAAEAKGLAAVVAAPAGGIADVVGSPRDVE